MQFRLVESTIRLPIPDTTVIIPTEESIRMPIEEEDITITIQEYMETIVAPLVGFADFYEGDFSDQDFLV